VTGPVGAPAAPAAIDAGPRSHEVDLAPAREPGQKLTVNGVLVRAEDRTPIPNHTFLVYQADATGDYRASDPDDERTARLRAEITTDAAGRFVIRTIVPGAYGTPLGDPHLHMEVRGAQPPMHVVYFEGFLQESTIRWQKTTEQAHIIAVTRGSDGSIAGNLLLPVRRVAR
jgi:protocatechuate 3,4-dioxygenase beta subunit